MPLQYLTREELYERIWEDSLTAVAQQLGVATSKLTECAVEMAVPRPPVGYWSKSRAGKSVLRPPLPPRPPGAALWVEIGGVASWGRDASEVLADPLPPEPVFTESLEELGTRLTSQGLPSGEDLAILLAAEASYRRRAKLIYQRKTEDRISAEESVRQRKASVKRSRERQRREQAERRRDRLFDQAEDWRAARDIRGLVAEVMSGSYGKRKTRHLQMWAEWALSEADLIDPVKQGGLVPPAQVRKAMRKRLSRRHTGGTRTTSSGNHFTKSDG